MIERPSPNQAVPLRSASRLEAESREKHPSLCSIARKVPHEVRTADRGMQVRSYTSALIKTRAREVLIMGPPTTVGVSVLWSGSCRVTFFECDFDTLAQSFSCQNGRSERSFTHSLKALTSEKSSCYVAIAIHFRNPIERSRVTPPLGRDLAPALGHRCRRLVLLPGRSQTHRSCALIYEIITTGVVDRSYRARALDDESRELGPARSARERSRVRL